MKTELYCIVRTNKYDMLCIVDGRQFSEGHEIALNAHITGGSRRISVR
jgi:hypothetical protein